MDHLFTLANVCDATTAALDPCKEVNEQKPVYGEDDIEEEWDVSDQSRSSEHNNSALERVTSLCESFSLLVLTTVIKRGTTD